MLTTVTVLLFGDGGGGGEEEEKEEEKEEEPMVIGIDYGGELHHPVKTGRHFPPRGR